MRFSVRGGFLTSFIIVLLLCLNADLQATTYFVSSSGNDSNSGTASNQAWKTVTKVNSKNFAAGDEVRFEGGSSFSGRIYFDASDAGTTNNPIVVSSFGNGRATINGGNSSGFYAYNVASLTVSNLNFIGAGPTVNGADGISFYADLAGGVKLSSIIIDSVEVSGFGNCGIDIGAWNGQTAYRNVRITNVSMHDNLQAGLGIYAAAAYANENFYVGHCSAYNHFGNPSSTKNTGSGIVLGDVNGGVIERCVAYDNGKNNLAPTEGPAGIWCYDSTNVVIQCNESFRNHTGSGVDGDGFDLDINVKNSVLQYNYSHDNDGAGFLLCAGTSNDGNVVRYNISQNDGRKNGYGAILTFGYVSNARVYNNTVFLNQITGSPKAVNLYSPTVNLRFYNNIFYTTGGARLLDIASGQSGLVFQGNDYFTGGSAFDLLYNGTSYSSFGSWQNASGQEKVGGVNVGLTVDPKLSSAGNGGSLTNANLLSTVTAYTLQTNSPVIDRGLDMSSLIGVNPVDYYGNATPSGNAYDIGANERSAVILARLAPPIKNGNQLQFSLTGAIGKTNAIEFTTNFGQWTFLTNVVNVTGNVTFVDSITNGASRFYRVRSL